MKLLQICRGQWDRTAGVVLVVAGLGALVAGWVGASDTVLTFEQIPYLISGGLAGMCLIVLGSAVWLSADLRDEWRKLDSLDDAFRSSQTGHEVDVRPADGEVRAQSGDIRQLGHEPAEAQA